MARGIILVLVAAVALGALFVALRPDPAAEEPQRRTIDIELRSDSMKPAEVTVGEGDRVTLEFIADKPVELHLHGYDLEEEVEPGGPNRLSLKAELTGRFEIENHETEAALGTLVVEPRGGG